MPYRVGEAALPSSILHPSSSPLRFIDLFCGIGGFRLAFERAGCRCVFSSDWDKHSQITYAANFGEKPHGDIHTVAVADIPKFDILCAGFPCQPFSIAGVSKKLSLGRKHGFDDEKQGNLFFSIADILDYHQPPVFVLENVKHLQRHDQGRTFQIIMDTLQNALGYTVYHRVIDARSVVPQHRERIFLVGFKPWRDLEFPDFPKDGPKLESILDAEVPAKYTLTDHLWQYLQDYAKKHQAAGNGLRKLVQPGLTRLCPFNSIQFPKAANGIATNLRTCGATNRSMLWRVVSSPQPASGSSCFSLPSRNRRASRNTTTGLSAKCYTGKARTDTRMICALRTLARTATRSMSYIVRGITNHFAISVRCE